MSDPFDLPAAHPFGIHNLPYAVFEHDGTSRVGSRLGDHVVDLCSIPGAPYADAWAQPSLDAFLALTLADWRHARAWLQELLSDREEQPALAGHLIALDEVTLRLPFTVGDYVDFYASEHHATNVGRIFRPDGEALTPNWKHLPIGYHGRSGTVVVSGTEIIRPCGQRKAPSDPAPVFGPSIRLDIEAELGFVVGGSPTTLGRPVSVGESDEHLFGVVLLNDWSARDIQAWEYVPLGPFLGKSFATSISPWVVTMEALRAARVALPGQDPEPLPYLRGEPTADGATTAYGLDIDYDVEWNGTLVSRPPYRTMYWSPAQMLAHMTVNGATIAPGDLFGSGTISGPERDQRGSFLELSWSGQEPVTLSDGSTRSFLEDGDTVTLRASAPGPDGSVIGLGECTGRIRPATP
ncbi:MAG: fumarylacetoacetase [Actinobacteria bacterium]|jgi:fumarylacetoacetate hydrolase (EC 3.7.1.2)|nr:fumarylacetoacetase [Actinomycetota bacterium]